MVYRVHDSFYHNFSCLHTFRKSLMRKYFHWQKVLINQFFVSETCFVCVFETNHRTFMTIINFSISLFIVVIYQQEMNDEILFSKRRGRLRRKDVVLLLFSHFKLKKKVRKSRHTTNIFHLSSMREKIRRKCSLFSLGKLNFLSYFLAAFLLNSQRILSESEECEATVTENFSYSPFRISV